MNKLSGAFLKQSNEPYVFKQRVIFIKIIISIVAIVFLARLFYLQILQYQLYAKMAQDNYEELSLLPAARGLIFDRKGILLARNRPQVSLLLLPDQAKQIPQTLTKLNLIVPLDKDKLTLNPLHYKNKPIVLKAQLTEEEIARIELHRYRFPGIYLHTYWSREYPLGSNVASLVGYISRINAEERQSTAFPYSVYDHIGKSGVEQYYETDLRGIKGSNQLTTNVRKKVLRTIEHHSPINGHNLYLTIDTTLQKSIQMHMKKHTGAVVAINPTNGEILALVNNPSFDPNHLLQGLYSGYAQKLPTSPSISFYNRALNGYYPPGSIIKPFISFGALESGVLKPSDMIYDTGRFQLSPTGKVYRNIYNIAWGNTNLYKAIAISSDIYFYQLSLKMGVDRIKQVLDKFGYGKLTEIDLPGEGKGFIPSRDWKENLYEENWYLGDTLNLGIGQGFMLATPLQMAVSTCAIAMQGKRWKPHVTLGWQYPNGTVHLTHPQALSPLSGSIKTWKVIQDAMRAVVLEGSAQKAFQNAPYTLGAKTGTAQVFSLKSDQQYDPTVIPENLLDHSLFVVFAPFDKPKIVLAIVLENSRIPAAYLARKILDDYFKVMGDLA